VLAGTWGRLVCDAAGTKAGAAAEKAGAANVKEGVDLGTKGAADAERGVVDAETAGAGAGSEMVGAAPETAAEKAAARSIAERVLGGVEVPGGGRPRKKADKKSAVMLSSLPAPDSSKAQACSACKPHLHGGNTSTAWRASHTFMAAIQSSAWRVHRRYGVGPYPSLGLHPNPTITDAFTTSQSNKIAGQPITLLHHSHYFIPVFWPSA
jgi:hypothetical protein